MDLRRAGLASIAVLIAQFVLGVAASLWVSIAAHHPWAHIGNVALLAVHGFLGVLIALMAIVIIGQAFDAGSRAAKIAASTSLAGVLVAIGCGVGFVASGGAAPYSFVMALGWALALCSNVSLALGR